MLRIFVSIVAMLWVTAGLGCIPAPGTAVSAGSSTQGDVELSESERSWAAVPREPRVPGGAEAGSVAPTQPPPVPHSMRRPPFVVRLEGPEAPKPGETIRVSIAIERQFIDSTPFHVQVALPVGADLVRGDLEEVIVDPERAVIERAIEVRLGRIPEGDLVVTVQQRGEGWGGFAERPYRFGRPEPTRPPLKRGEPVDLPGKFGGRPVILD